MSRRGNSGATRKNDFIELFNPGATEVDVSGWSVQHASSAGSGGTTSLPQPDGSGSINLSGTTGKVAVVVNQTSLTCGGAWHHVAATLQTTSGRLTLYLDGVQVAQISVAASSSGNALPVQIGRNGPTGKYFQGRLDDLRIWTVARSASDSASAYWTELSSATAGLVANAVFIVDGHP